MSESIKLSDQDLLKLLTNLKKSATTQSMEVLHKQNFSLYRKELINKYKDFSIDYPSLFELFIEDPVNFDMDRLFNMLKLKKNVESQNISYETASAKIGQEYFDEFVQPVVDVLDEKPVGE